jgi:hypothetical protein
MASLIVVGFRMGPDGPSLDPPFANLHDGNPVGLPSYTGGQGGGVSAGSFERIEVSADPPNLVLDTFERTIDRAVWTVASRGRSNIALIFRADPGIRGGVIVIPADSGSHITLFVEDMRLPTAFPLDFPIGHRARATDEPGDISNGVFHVRWNVAGNAGGGRFIERFAQALEDAGWQVVTKQAEVTGPHSLTCRSRAKPELSCRAVVSVKFGRFPSGSTVMEIADVWVGPGAESSR